MIHSPSFEDDWFPKDHHQARRALAHDGIREWEAMAKRGSTNGRRKKERMPRRLFKERHNPSIPPGIPIIRNPAGQERMSEVLEDFTEPYLDLVDSEEAMYKLLTLAILAWNAAILPVNEGRAVIDETLGEALVGASKEDRAQAMEIVESMIRRKHEHFEANQRMITSFELSNKGGKLHLDVMYAL